MKSVRSWVCPGNVDMEVLERCKSAIRQVVAGAEVILYGSRARGDASDDSDYDVVVVVNGPVDMALEDRIRANVYPLQLESGAMFTLIVHSREEWQSPLHRATPFHADVDHDGVML
jgi:predicted nucleotidyltransferase